MTEHAIKKIEAAILKDGSFTEERKAELLLLLTTLQPEVDAPPTPGTWRRGFAPVRDGDRLIE